MGRITSQVRGYHRCEGETSRDFLAPRQVVCGRLLPFSKLSGVINPRTDCTESSHCLRHFASPRLRQKCPFARIHRRILGLCPGENAPESLTRGGGAKVRPSGDFAEETGPMYCNPFAEAHTQFIERSDSRLGAVKSRQQQLELRLSLCRFVEQSAAAEIRRTRLAELRKPKLICCTLDVDFKVPSC